VWGVQRPKHGYSARTLFGTLMQNYFRLSRQEMLESVGWLDLSGRSEATATEPSRQELWWTGTEERSRGNTVGLAMLRSDERVPRPQDHVHEAFSCTYFEIEVLDAGAHGFIAIGWAPREFAEKQKQPGWVRDTYGYHGDDGCCYSGYGYGRRFGPTFTTGSVRPHSSHAPPPALHPLPPRVTLPPTR